LCSLPSPHRVPHSVAGMAFNFSKVELPHPATRRNAAKQDSQVAPVNSVCVEIPKSRPDISQ
jgi:hypothetical protein